MRVLSNEIKSLSGFLDDCLNRPKAPNLPQGSVGISSEAAFSGNYGYSWEQNALNLLSAAWRHLCQLHGSNQAGSAELTSAPDFPTVPHRWSHCTRAGSPVSDWQERGGAGRLHSDKYSSVTKSDTQQICNTLNSAIFSLFNLNLSLVCTGLVYTDQTSHTGGAGGSGIFKYGQSSLSNPPWSHRGERFCRLAGQLCSAESLLNLGCPPNGSPQEILPVAGAQRKSQGRQVKA